MANTSLLPRNGRRAELRRLYHLAWDPSSQPSGLAARVDTLANELRCFFEVGLEEASAPTSSRPASLVFEDDEQIQICVDLAGVEPADIEISLLSPGAPLQLLCIRAVRRERGTTRSFTHTLSLTNPVQVEEVEANFKEGTLRIQCPKPKQSTRRIRRIPIAGVI